MILFSQANPDVIRARRPKGFKNGAGISSSIQCKFPDRVKSVNNNAQIPAAKGALYFFMIVGGALLICIGLMCIRLSTRDYVLWQNRDQYVRTEMVVLDFCPQGEPPTADVRIEATGEELSTPETGGALVVFDGPDDMTGTQRTRKDAIGRRIPIWYNPDAFRFFSDCRVVPEYEVLPTGQQVVKIFAIQGAFFLLGGSMFFVSIRILSKILPKDRKKGHRRLR